MFLLLTKATKAYEQNFFLSGTFYFGMIRFLIMLIHFSFSLDILSIHPPSSLQPMQALGFFHNTLPFSSVVCHLSPPTGIKSSEVQPRLSSHLFFGLPFGPLPPGLPRNSQSSFLGNLTILFLPFFQLTRNIPASPQSYCSSLFLLILRSGCSSKIMFLCYFA